MNYPSIKTIVSGLDVDKNTAETVRRYMRTFVPHTAMKLSNSLIDGSMGVEYIQSVSDSVDDYTDDDLCGIDYLNFGDTYVTTLLFDYTRGRYRICSVGDVVESNPRRFGA